MGDFKEAVRSGDRRRALEALRDQLADKLDAGICRSCGGPRGEAAGMASLALRLMKVFEALDALPTEKEVSVRDEIAEQRRRRREAAAQNPLDAIRREQQRGPGGS